MERDQRDKFIYAMKEECDIKKQKGFGDNFNNAFIRYTCDYGYHICKSGEIDRGRQLDKGIGPNVV